MLFLFLLLLLCLVNLVSHTPMSCVVMSCLVKVFALFIFFFLSFPPPPPPYKPYRSRLFFFIHPAKKSSPGGFDVDALNPQPPPPPPPSPPPDPCTGAQSAVSLFVLLVLMLRVRLLADRHGGEAEPNARDGAGQGMHDLGGTRGGGGGVRDH